MTSPTFTSIHEEDLWLESARNNEQLNHGKRPGETYYLKLQLALVNRDLPTIMSIAASDEELIGSVDVAIDMVVSPACLP